MEILSIEDVLEFVRNDKGSMLCNYLYDVDLHTGSLGWCMKDEPDIIVWATPNWDDTNRMPFDIAYSDGNYQSFCNVDASNLSKEHQLKLYFTVLTLAMDYVDGVRKSLSEEEV